MDAKQRMVNVAQNFFLPLEKHLGHFQVEPGADKLAVLAMWAEVLGDYEPASLLWFCEHWLRTNKWGKFPRSPGQVVDTLREHGKAKAVLALPAPDEWATERQEFAEWYNHHVRQHRPDLGRPFYWRLCAEWAIDKMLEARCKATGETRERAALALWRADDLPGDMEARVVEVKADYERQRDAWKADANSLVRACGSLYETAWLAEQKGYDDAVALLEKHKG